MAGTSPSTATRSWTRGAMVRKTASSKRSGGHGARPGASQGPAASTKSSTDMARRYSLFIHSSFFTSKNAGAWFTSDSSNARHHLLDGEDLAALGIAPPEQRQVVAHGRRPGSPRSR